MSALDVLNRWCNRMYCTKRENALVEGHRRSRRPLSFPKPNHIILVPKPNQTWIEVLRGKLRSWAWMPKGLKVNCMPGYGMKGTWPNGVMEELGMSMWWLYLYWENIVGNGSGILLKGAPNTWEQTRNAGWKIKRPSQTGTTSVHGVQCDSDRRC